MSVRSSPDHYTSFKLRSQARLHRLVMLRATCPIMPLFISAITGAPRPIRLRHSRRPLLQMQSPPASERFSLRKQARLSALEQPRSPCYGLRTGLPDKRRALSPISSAAGRVGVSADSYRDA